MKTEENSYSPYSGIQEYCIVRGQSGLKYPGVRIENISFPLTISAVQAGLCSCLANGDTPVSIQQYLSESELTSYWMNEFDIQNSAEDNISGSVFNPVIKADVDVLETLHKLSEQAVAPHSDFPVAALLKVSDGFIPGVNVEVSSWGLGLCAERVAISRAVSAGYFQFENIHIYAPKGEFISPCGACRQVLAEFMPSSGAILHHGDGTLSRHTISDLLPFGFTTSSLKK